MGLRFSMGYIPLAKKNLVENIPLAQDHFLNLSLFFTWPSIYLDNRRCGFPMVTAWLLPFSQSDIRAIISAPYLFGAVTFVLFAVATPNKYGNLLFERRMTSRRLREFLPVNDFHTFQWLFPFTWGDSQQLGVAATATVLGDRSRSYSGTSIMKLRNFY